jgi:hypothetical protein
MDLGELEARYRDVVAAATDLVAAMDRSGIRPATPARQALDELRAALVGAPPPPSAGPRRDPRRHLLGAHRWERGADGNTSPRPYPLAEAATEFRRLVEGGRDIESHLYQPRDEGGQAISRVRALVLANLMDEFAARLRPGTAVGPIDADDSFGGLVAELADHLFSNTPF